MEREKQVGPRIMPDTLEASQAMFDDLNTQIIQLDAKMREVRALAKTERHYADPTWYRRATQALAFMKADRQRLVQHMAALRRLDRQKTNRKVNDLLVEELRALVTPEEFAEAVERATERAL